MPPRSERWEVGPLTTKQGRRRYGNRCTRSAAANPGMDYRGHKEIRPLEDHSSHECSRILAERDEGKIVIMCPVTRRMCRNNTCAWTAACRFQQLEEGRLIAAITTHGPAASSLEKLSVWHARGDGIKIAAIATQEGSRELFLFDTFLKRVVPHRALWPQGETRDRAARSVAHRTQRNVDRLRADLVDQPNTEGGRTRRGRRPQYRLDSARSGNSEMFLFRASDPHRGPIGRMPRILNSRCVWSGKRT